MLLQLRTFTLPVAMLLGYLFSGFLAGFAWLTPWLIFGMLFFSFCRIHPSEMKPSRIHLWLLVAQFGLAAGIYLLLSGFTELGAQSLMVCALAPTATAAIAIAGMLGANIATMATYTMLCNLVVAIVAPVVFSLVGTHAEMPFLESFLIILRKVFPLLMIPFLASVALHFFWRRAAAYLGSFQTASFYMWALSLTIVTGQTVEFIKATDAGNYSTEIAIAAGAFVVCVMQFALGRAIGRRYGDNIAGGQSLGQKNTVLAIWMSQIYLDPLASIGPASYVLWQNIVNSWQLWQKGRQQKENK